MKLKHALLSSVLLLSLAGCAEEKDYTIYEGYIVDKIFNEGYYYTTFITSGNTRVPVIHHVPDKWYVVIYKDEQIAKHRVSQKFYDTFTIGSYVTLGEGYTYGGLDNA